jgi:DNA-binding NarL/FixJ family response regulator
MKVLVVEDDFLIAEDLRQTLETLGWQVVGPAPSVRASLQLLERERPTVAVLDIHLMQEVVTPVAAALRAMGIPFIASSSVLNVEAVDPDVFRGIVNVGDLRPDSPPAFRRIRRLISGATPHAFPAPSLP